MTNTKCRFCGKELTSVFADLNMAPLVNNYIKPEKRRAAEVTYPLITYVCDECKLVQTMDFNAAGEIFTDDYAYFSSFSTSWLKHCEQYADMIIRRLGLNEKSHVMEIASNDGYMLQYFKRNNIPLLGIEPCKSVADAAILKGIPTMQEFFTSELSEKLPKSDLICMANVLAHVPDINDFVKGIKNALKPDGTVTIEFPHLLNIIRYNQFDTIYHEHFSYISLIFAQRLFSANGLELYDVEKLPTHGGSLRVYARHAISGGSVSPHVAELLAEEKSFGLEKMETYAAFAENVKKIKRDLLRLLIDIKDAGKSIVAYGAAAKGNTLFNYCGISTDFIDYSVDLNPQKQNIFLPGSHILTMHPDTIRQTKPDYILITAWNLKDEIIKQLSYTSEWGCRFITAIPEPGILQTPESGK